MGAAATHLSHPVWHDAEAMKYLRSELLKFCSARIRDPQLAEDVVQETLAAAIRDEARFAGRAAFKTWVFAILKHKIADLARSKSRREFQVPPDESAVLANSYTDSGEWRSDAKPRAWHDPDGAWQQYEFFSAFEQCLEGLPPAQGRAFVMREVLEVKVPDIADELGVTKATVSVWLHRARHRLRACLERNWFAAPDEAEPTP